MVANKVGKAIADDRNAMKKPSKIKGILMKVLVAPIISRVVINCLREYTDNFTVLYITRTATKITIPATIGNLPKMR